MKARHPDRGWVGTTIAAVKIKHPDNYTPQVFSQKKKDSNSKVLSLLIEMRQKILQALIPFQWKYQINTNNSRIIQFELFGEPAFVAI